MRPLLSAFSIARRTREKRARRGTHDLCKSFSMSSVLADLLPSWSLKIWAYTPGLPNRRNMLPHVSSQISPRRRLGRPTRTSRVKDG